MNSPQKQSCILSVQKLNIHRGKTQILQGINWSVHKDEHWAILGPNGSGKSSLLSSLMAYLTPSSGNIEILGKTFGQSNWTEMRNQIGMVSNAITRDIPNNELTIETVLSGENSQLGFWSREKPTHINKALSCMEKTGVTDLKHREWGLLSQGERQKVFIARALMSDPKILILDESCAGLDPIARQNFLKQVRQIIKEKPAPNIIFVTHHIEEILPEITHVLLLKKGQIHASGKKEEILTSENLSETFNAPITVEKGKNEQYGIQFLD